MRAVGERPERRAARCTASNARRRAALEGRARLRRRERERGVLSLVGPVGPLRSSCPARRVDREGPRRRRRIDVARHVRRAHRERVLPSASGPSVRGDVQAANPSPGRRACTRRSTPASLTENVNRRGRRRPAAGVDRRLRRRRVDRERPRRRRRSGLPAASVARTANVCSPSGSAASAAARCTTRTPRVEPALEGRARLARGERERASVAPAVERRLAAARRVDRERPPRRRRVDVAGRVRSRGRRTCARHRRSAAGVNGDVQAANAPPSSCTRRSPRLGRGERERRAARTRSSSRASAVVAPGAVDAELGEVAERRARRPGRTAASAGRSGRRSRPRSA